MEKKPVDWLGNGRDPASWCYRSDFVGGLGEGILTYFISNLINPTLAKYDINSSSFPFSPLHCTTDNKLHRKAISTELHQKTVLEKVKKPPLERRRTREKVVKYVDTTQATTSAHNNGWISTRHEKEHPPTRNAHPNREKKRELSCFQINSIELNSNTKKAVGPRYLQMWPCVFVYLCGNDDSSDVKVVLRPLEKGWEWVEGGVTSSRWTIFIVAVPLLALGTTIPEGSSYSGVIKCNEFPDFNWKLAFYRFRRKDGTGLFVEDKWFFGWSWPHGNCVRIS